MKVTRKKSYNVSTFQGAGPPPPPIHYLLRRPRRRPISRRGPPRRPRALANRGLRGATPRGRMGGCPPCAPPRPLRARPRAPPAPQPFIRARSLNKGRRAQRGTGPPIRGQVVSQVAPSTHSPTHPGERPGRGQRGCGAHTGLAGLGAGRSRKWWGLPASSVREAPASGSGSLHHHPHYHHHYHSRHPNTSAVREWGGSPDQGAPRARTVWMETEAWGGASCARVTWPRPSRCHPGLPRSPLPACLHPPPPRSGSLPETRPPEP